MRYSCSYRRDKPSHDGLLKKEDDDWEQVSLRRRHWCSSCWKMPQVSNIPLEMCSFQLRCALVFSGLRTASLPFCRHNGTKDDPTDLSQLEAGLRDRCFKKKGKAEQHWLTIE